MAQRRHHYEQAVEEYLRARRIPYVAVDEAKKALLPPGRRNTGPGRHATEDASARPRIGSVPGIGGDGGGMLARTGGLGGSHGGDGDGGALKSFDFVLYGQGNNLLVEVKGRQFGGRRRAGGGLDRAGRMECWVTLEDVESLRRWEALFGPDFEAIFLFVYWCEAQPPDALFLEMFEHRGRWYALRAVSVREYARAMRTRSPRWGTVHLSPDAFERLSTPLSGSEPYPLPDSRSVASRSLFRRPDPFRGSEGDGLPALPRIDTLVGVLT